MSKYVIMTGSFNPITRAHRIILEAAIDRVQADYGLVVITNDKYLTKKNVVDNKKPNPFHLSETVRKDMIDSLNEEFPNIQFQGKELGNESPSTERTLLSIKKKYKPTDKFYFLQGADKLKGMPHWKNFTDMIDKFNLIIYPRVGFDIESIINESELLKENRDKIIVLDSLEGTSGISSTLLREHFFKGEDYPDIMDKGPYSIMKRYTPADFPPVSTEEVIKDTLLYGGRFGGNAARIKVYKDNTTLFKEWDETKLGKKEDLLNGTQVYTEEFKITPTSHNYETHTAVMNEDCSVVAEGLINEGLNPAILNLASNIHPCGGYPKGSNAQEESLCYMSTLSQSLYQFGSTRYKCTRDANVPNYPDVYPLNINFGGIYSSHITFFRYNSSEYYQLRENPFKTSIITVASLANSDSNEYHMDESRYFNPDGTLNAEGKAIESQKIRTIYRIALDHHHDSLVLGAFGCGVYHLLPEEVAQLFKDILNEDEFKHQFKKVIFAIYEGKGSYRKVVGPEGKFKPFYDIFNN